MCGIYKITNTINGKAYVGQATNISVRLKNHRSDAFNPNKPGYDYPLYRAIRKYGLENFRFEIIVHVSWVTIFSILNQSHD